MRNDTAITKIFKLLAPLFMYFGVNLFVSIIYMSLKSDLMMGIVNANTQASLDAATKAYTEQINKDGLLLTGAVVILCLPILISMYRKDSSKLVPIEANRNPISYALLAVLGVSSAVSLNFLISISGIGALLEDTYQNSASVIFSAPIWIQFTVGAVMGPILEELIFRGVIYRRLRTYAIIPLAVLISAIIFGAYHMNLLQFIYAGALGMILAYVYEKYHSLAASCIVHISGNAFAIVLTDSVGVANLLGGTDERAIITTIVSSIIMVVCLIYVVKIKNTNETEMYEEVC